MAVDEKQVEEIVRGVVDNLFGSKNSTSLKVVSPGVSSGDGLFDTIKEAISAAKDAQKSFEALGKDIRFKIVENIRKASLANKERLAKMAVEETKMGRYEDKIVKNEVAADLSIGPEELEVKSYMSGDMMISSTGSPFGVVGAINPMTNPTACVINTCIVVLSAGNSIVFLPHPAAHNCTIETFKVIHKAIVDAGGPPNVITAARESKIENVSSVFKSDDIDIISAVGGPGIVRLSMKSGKRVIGAGPGNPPVIVDDSADIENAAESIMLGASFDNNILCNEEKVIICLKSVLDKLLSAFPKYKTVVLDKGQAEAVVKLVVKEGEIDKNYMGKDLDLILKDAGINVSSDMRLAVFLTDESNPMVQHEQLMPIVPIVAVNTFDEAVDMACRVEHGFRHSASVHSKNIDNITKFSQAIKTTGFVVNAGSQAVAVKPVYGGTAWTIAGATGEGYATPSTFTRFRKIFINDGMNFSK